MVPPRVGTLILDQNFEVRVDALSEAARAIFNRWLHGKPLSSKGGRASPGGKEG